MKYFVILFLLLSASSYAQDVDHSLEKTLNAYDNYFEMPRESLHLHLNKSSYLRGEHVWFQGYAYDRQSQNLSDDVRNVELRVYNNAGQMLDKQLLLAIDGKFFGQVEIDSTYADGNYYLKAETNWMKNFEEEYVHVQQFEVLKTDEKIGRQANSSYDLQILPEGGQLVNNLRSNIALKLINQNGLGVKFRAQLFEDGTQVNSTVSNQFGHAVMSITPKSDKTYNLVATLPKDDVLEQQITDIKPYGQVLSINNLRQEETIISVGSHMPEGFDYAENSFEMLLHREGERITFPIKLTNENTVTTKVLDKEYLFDGVNTFTLLYNGKPVAERLVFNRSTIISSSDDIELTEVRHTQKDSMSLKLTMPYLNESAFMSVSVLPKHTIAYQKNNNIVSSFLLEPFVNGFIEDKGHYFITPDAGKDLDLDLLLLTQGWSKYSWDNIYNNTPDLAFERKDGLRQVIDFQQGLPRKAKQVLIYNTIYNEEQVIDVADINLNTIVLDNRYPFIGEDLEFSYVTKTTKLKQPLVYINTQLSLYDENLNQAYFQPSISIQRDIKLEASSNRLYANFFTGEVLDEVEVQGKKYEAKFLSEIYGNVWFPHREKIDRETAIQYPLLVDYLRVKCPRGGRVVLNGQHFNRNMPTFDRLSGSFNTRFVGNRGSNAIMNNPGNLSIINDQTRTDEIETVQCGSMGFGSFGGRNGGGVIELKYRISPLRGGKLNYKLPYIKKEIKDGFTAPKVFYNPEYTFYNTKAYQQIGTIHWEPNLTLDANKAYYLDMLDTGLEEFTLYIEGVTEKGKLIHIKKEYSKSLKNQNP